MRLIRAGVPVNTAGPVELMGRATGPASLVGANTCNTDWWRPYSAATSCGEGTFAATSTNDGFSTVAGICEAGKRYRITITDMVSVDGPEFSVTARTDTSGGGVTLILPPGGTAEYQFDDLDPDPNIYLRGANAGTYTFSSITIVEIPAARDLVIGSGLDNLVTGGGDQLVAF